MAKPESQASSILLGEPQGEKNLQPRRGNAQSRVSGGSAYLNAGAGNTQAWVLGSGKRGSRPGRGSKVVCGAQCPGRVVTQAQGAAQGQGSVRKGQLLFVPNSQCLSGNLEKHNSPSRKPAHIPAGSPESQALGHI